MQDLYPLQKEKKIKKQRKGLGTDYPGPGERKSVKVMLATMKTMAAMAITNQSPSKKFLLQNGKASDFETLYVHIALSILVLQRLFK